MTAKERMMAARGRAKAKMDEEKKDYESNIQRGSIAPSSAFGTELKPTGQSAALVQDDFEKRSPSNMAMALNPRPHSRLRWQRKMVIREIKRRGRTNKTVLLARTEREHTSRSHFFKTSMKKLAPLARQIAGKPIDEAILQMRFSNKKVAQDVRQHLIQARKRSHRRQGHGPRSPWYRHIRTTIRPQRDAVPSSPDTLESPQKGRGRRSDRHLRRPSVDQSRSIRSRTRLPRARTHVHEKTAAHRPERDAEGRENPDEGEGREGRSSHQEEIGQEHVGAFA